MRKLLVILLVGVLSISIFAGAAAAAQIDLGRFGRLWGQGSGAAHLEGGGHLKGTLEAGALIVHGELEDIRVDLEGRGHRHVVDNGFVFEGVHGSFHLVGRHLVVNIAGADATVYAAGNWDIALKGVGTYKTGDGQNGRWNGGTIAVSGDTEAAIEEALAAD